MTTLHDTEVDGVRCFWVDTGRPTLAARLVFRGGMADEPLTESGWQHLLEHMALDQFGRGGSVDVNGHVNLHETAFDFHGDPGAVADRLTRLVRWLAAPSFDRLDHEIGVLRAEADVRGGTALGRALSWRYGALGPGVAAFAEPGLGRATADDLAARAARIFTHQNGVLILDGPPPPGMTVPLPPGELLALPPAVPVESPPAAYEEGAGIVVSGVVSRDGDMFVGAEVLHRVLVEKLRHDEGGAYAPWTNYERVDARTAVVTAGSDIRPELTGSIIGTVTQLLDQLAQHGPRQDWLDETVDRIIRGMLDPYSAIGTALGAGLRHLHGREPETLDEMVERVRATTVETLAVGFRELRDSLLVGAPEAALEAHPLRRLQFPTTSPSDHGRTFNSINWPADTSRMRITEQALEITGGFGTRQVRLDDLVGWFVYADGARQALRSDGYALGIDPRWWTAGHEAVAELDRRIPPEMHLPHPAVLEAEGPRRDGLVRRWWPAVRRRLSTPRAAYVGVFALYLLFAVGFVGSMVKFGDGPTGIVVIALIWGAVAIHRGMREGMADSS